MRNNLKKIQGMLKKFEGYEVSPELDRKILKAITITRAESVTLSPSFFIYLKNIFMVQIKRYAATVAVAVLLFVGFMYFTQNSYAYHLNKARISLAQLDALINGKPDQTSFISVAFASDESSGKSAVDEKRVIDLATDVDSETESAIDLAEHISNPETLKKALEEINDLQDQSVDILSDAVAAVNSEEATAKISSALMATTKEQGLVSKAIKYAANASVSGEKEVNIEIEKAPRKKNIAPKKSAGDNVKTVAVDSPMPSEVVENYRNAKKAVEDLKVKGTSGKEISDLEGKLLKTESALAQNKFGRAHGLTTAIQAKSMNTIRKAEKMADRAEKKEIDGNKSGKGDIKNPEDKTSSNTNFNKPSDDNKDNSRPDFPKNVPSQPAGKNQDPSKIKWNLNIKRPSLQNTDNKRNEITE